MALTLDGVEGASKLSDSAMAAQDIYAKDNILGTVSQSGGIPTGAIIERDSNVNGEYVKYADGTMICFFTETDLYTTSGTAQVLFYAASLTFSFPALFISAPIITGTAKDSINSASWCCTTATSTSQVSCIVYATINTAQGRRGYIAIGRWF